MLHPLHSLSKDKAFDALVTHLRSQGMRVIRTEVFSRIAALVDVKALPFEERLLKVQDRTGKLKADGRPKKLKKLQPMIHSLFHKELSEQEVVAVIKRMMKQKVITVSNQESVSYS